MNIATVYDDLQVIGSMIAPAVDKLPLRLSPVYQSKSDPGQYFVPVDDSDPAELILNQEDVAFIEREVAEGGLALFEQPLDAKATHWVMQFTMDDGPEVIAPEEALKKLAQASKEALRQAASYLKRGNRDMAEERLAYAWRSASGDPIPLLAFLVLIRPTAELARISALEDDLKQYNTEHIERALEGASPELVPVITLIREARANSTRQQRATSAREQDEKRANPVASLPPDDFLSGFPKRQGFLRQARNSVAFTI